MSAQCSERNREEKDPKTKPEKMRRTFIFKVIYFIGYVIINL